MLEHQFLDRVIELLPALRAFGRSLCRDPVRADDLVQDTFLKAWLNWSQFRSDSNLKAWLFTILANAYYSELRHRRHEIEDPDEVYAERLTVTANLDGELQIDELNRALDRLPPTQKDALLLACASGLSYGRVAELCGVAIGTIKSRIARGRADLIDRLGERWVSADVPRFAHPAYRRSGHVRALVRHSI